MTNRAAETPNPRQMLDDPAGATSSASLDVTVSAAGRLPTIVPLTVGGNLGPYRVLEKLGEGGMGAVYKAVHTKLDKVVAIKVLPTDFINDPEAVARFEREMKAVGKLNHPHIVQAHDGGVIDGTHYLAMEFVDGSDLQKLVKDRGPFSVVNACKIVRQAAQALAAAHGAGLVHRDIKPSNLLVAKNGQIKLLDLGLARLANEASTHAIELTSAGQTFGTPDYMAPEQWEDAHEVDGRADLYALGCTLYYLLIGHAPFATDQYRSVVSKMKAHVTNPIPSLKAARADVPDEVVAVYQRLLAKRPDERFTTAAELAEALAPFTSSKTASKSPPVTDSAPPEADGPRPVGLRTLPLNINTEVTSRRPTKKSAGSGKRWNFRPLSLAAGGAAAVFLLGVILITITDKEGKKTQFTVPTGTKTNINVGPESTVEISEQSEAASHSTAWHDWPADAPKPAIAPFDAAQAKQHQEEWAAYLKVPVEYTNSIGMKFRLIPPGEFLMGSTPAQIEESLKAAAPGVWESPDWPDMIRSEGPQRKVVLSQPFYFGIHEVTQGEYEKVMGTNPSAFAKTGRVESLSKKVAAMDTSVHPVEMVNWIDAAEFCAKLSHQEGSKPFYFRSNEKVTPLNGTGYRLPTEAEWEMACRAGTVTQFWIGDTEEALGDAAWFFKNADHRSHAVGELKANPYGLLDIHGNVLEWVQDGWDAKYYHRFGKHSVLNPYSPFSSESPRMIRGSHHRGSAACMGSSARYAMNPDTYSSQTGFRLALPVDAVRKALIAKSTPLFKSGWHGWPLDAPKPAIAPFDAAQAKQHQEEWAAYLKVPVEYTNSIGMKFRLIPPGEFLMGGTEEVIKEALGVASNDEYWRTCLQSEGPQHKVVLTKPFYLGIVEVTQKQYVAIMKQNPSHFGPMGSGKDVVAGMDTTSLPAEQVSWYDADEFCTKLSQQERHKPFTLGTDGTVSLLEGTGYRLPTEAEWEFACRAGTMTAFWIGEHDDELLRAGWLKSNSGDRTHPSGELKSNPFGLFDVHGNVWEWVQDGWKPDYNYYDLFRKRPARDPNGPSFSGDRRVMRGGSWQGVVSQCRSSNRYAHEPEMRLDYLGFRVATPVELAKAATANQAP